MTIQIRPAQLGDAADLYQTWQGLRQHNATIDQRIVNAPVSRDEFVEAMDSILGRSHSATFVAEDDGRVVGFVRGVIETQQPDRLPEQHATIGYLFVAPEYRRLGLGRKLFSAVAEWAGQQDGIQHFEMTVLASDAEATGFWGNLGFSPFIQRLWAPLPGNVR
ncbi:hypothetical protein AYO38_00850 [bacterium SCGC AG-212-C10]|nr:hypothetical protein AYO38_00850 [bacterium SCGC AG-212-C10]